MARPQFNYESANDIEVGFLSKANLAKLNNQSTHDQSVIKQRRLEKQAGKLPRLQHPRHQLEQPGWGDAEADRNNNKNKKDSLISKFTFDKNLQVREQMSQQLNKYHNLAEEMRDMVLNQFKPQVLKTIQLGRSLQLNIIALKE